MYEFGKNRKFKKAEIKLNEIIEEWNRQEEHFKSMYKVEASKIARWDRPKAMLEILYYEEKNKPKNPILAKKEEEKARCEKLRDNLKKAKRERNSKTRVLSNKPKPKGFRLGGSVT